MVRESGEAPVEGKGSGDPLRRRCHLVLPAQGGRGKGAECSTEAICEVRFDTASGEDTADRIWAVCRAECEAAGKETCHVRLPRFHAHLRTQPEGEVHSTREDNQKAAPQGVAGDCRMVPRAPARCCERATENPECQAPRPLPILRATDELSLSLVVLSEGPSYLAGVAESPHARAMADVGEIRGNPATASVVATADHALPGGCGEHGLKNPLREICTVGSVRGEIMVSHGGLKRARNWKRWRQPKKAYSLPRSPLLGGFTQRLRASLSLDTPLQDLAAMKALGLNIIGLSDFHFELNGTDPDGLRFKDQKDYFEGSQRASDRDFLVLPWEEPSAFFGGHYNILWTRNVYWSKVRKEGQPFTETDPVYGKVYHTGSAADVQKMMDAEGVYWYHAHPRTKGTTGYPDAIFEKEWSKNDRYLGVAFKQGMGMDLSEKRLCEWRCFDAVDTMNNLYADSSVLPKYLIADIDTYRKGPEDDLYPNFPVNYLRLAHVPGPDEDWTPILRALRDGDFFVTTGEILIKSYSVEGRGNQRAILADVEWTFPLEFAEVIWGDGKNIHTQTISATGLPPFGTKHFAIPFDATGKSWVRFAVWDSAGDGAFVQSVWLNMQGRRMLRD